MNKFLVYVAAGNWAETLRLYYRKFMDSYPVDTGPKLNVHKAFRRRPGRLLNVLCTFNLRPVYTR